MNATDNVIVATFNERTRKVVVGPLWQYDYGQILKFEGIDLPAAYEVHFSNDPRWGEAKRVTGTQDGVVIPSSCLTRGANVFAWLFLHTGAGDGGTKFEVEIQVRRRPQASKTEIPDEVEEEASEIIADITAVANAAKDAKDAAVAAAESAASERSAADAAAVLAQSYAEGGTGTRNGEDTNNAKYWSEQSAAAAAEAVQDVADAKDAALADIQSETEAAEAYKDAAEAAQAAAETAQAAAEGARDSAQAYATRAEAAVQEAMYVTFDIEDGDLVMTKTANLTSFDFTLEEGDLIFNAVTSN